MLLARGSLVQEVLALFRGLGLLPFHVYLRSVLGVSYALYLAPDWGRIAQAFVSYRDILPKVGILPLISVIYRLLW
jgi:hypothetical protein